MTISVLAGAGDVQFGTVSDWVASSVTFLALSFALWQAWSSRRANRLQVERGQAERISAWHARDDLPTTNSEDKLGRTVLAIRNGSDEPVYDAVIFLAPVQGALPHTGEDWMKVAPDTVGMRMAALPVLPPGSWEVDVAGGWYVHQARGAAEVAFTDRHRRHWIRRNDGALEQIKTPAAEHYRLGRPLDYKTPRPLRDGAAN